MIGISAKRVEGEQIAIVADQHIGMAVDRQLQKFVVLRITASGDPLGDFHKLGRRHQLMQPIEKIWRDQWREARPV